MGVPVSALTLEAAVTALLDAPASGARLAVHFVTVHTLVASHDRADLRDALVRADLVATDGMPLVWIARRRGLAAERVCGPDLMPILVDRSRATGGRHFFFGGAPGVAERLARRLERQFPGVTIAGTLAPPFRPLTIEEDAEVVETINRARPDYVWVGLGSPKQDLWVAEHRDRLTAGALLAVGAAFDMHAGYRRRAPGWMQRSGTEWLFRLASEPRRLARRYTVTNARFAWLLTREVLRARIIRPERHLR